MIGVVLDCVLYPLTITWQPPWLTFVLGLGEFVILYVLAQALHVGLAPVDAIVWYWFAWTLAICTKIVILPIVSLTWIESGGQFRPTDWSVNLTNEPMPLIASFAPEGESRLVREFSAINSIPAGVDA